MLLNTSCRLLLLATAVVGCGPEVELKRDRDWMLGTFSSTDAGDRTLALASVGHYEFRADGTLTRIALTHCEENREELIQEYKWRSDGDLQVIVDVPEQENEVFQTWIVTPGEDCNTLRVDKIQDGEPRGGLTLWRGAVCMKELPPCGGYDCPSCETLWCDEPPPECEE